MADPQSFKNCSIPQSSNAPSGLCKKTDRLSTRPPLPTTTTLFSRSKSDLISYEDLLVTQYIENLKQQKTKVFQPKNHTPLSPYLQRSSKLEYIGRVKNRPTSAITCHCQTHCHQHGSQWEAEYVSQQGSQMDFPKYQCNDSNHLCCCPSQNKPKIDAKFIADSSIWDPATPRFHHPTRPVSAPIKRLRPPSGYSMKLRPSSAHKTLYKNEIIKASTYINGSREKFVQVAASTWEIFLQTATEKLSLPFAARRVFLENGRELFSPKDMFRFGTNTVFVSMGEPFKDPDLRAKRNLEIKNNCQWTLTGIVVPDEVKNKGTKIKITKRMKTLSENQKLRILIYTNGCFQEPQVVVADIGDFDGFLIQCKTRLGLPRHAKLAFDWNGKQITEISEVQAIDETINPIGKVPIFGPLWISMGERYSAVGIRRYLLNKKKEVKKKIQESKVIKQQINFALNDQKEKVTDPTVMGIKSKKELNEAFYKVDEELDKFTDILSEIKEKADALKEEALKEEGQGLNYRLGHIKAMDGDDRLLGTKGIKLKVFENGKSDGEFIFYFNKREASKGIEKADLVMQRLLDELSNSKLTAGVNRNLNAVATKLFDKEGHEIKSVDSLQSEQSVWLSFGEPFICPYTYALHLFLDKATKVMNSKGEIKILKEAATGEDELIKDASAWEAYPQFPDSYEMKEQYDDSKIEFLLQNSELEANFHYLLHKEKHDKALYAEISISEKTAVKNQVFIYSEAGYLYCKAMPQMCLAVSNRRTEVQIMNTDWRVDGFIICMEKKMPNQHNQLWRCLPDASISSEAHPSLLLTYTGQKRWDPSNDEKENNAMNASLIVTDPLPKNQKGFQRFAFKQERFDNLGQWKFTDTTNAEWHKLAYSWPVRADGELNKNYDWPMEGYIIPNVPPIKKKSTKSGLSGVTPARLRVLKNGEKTTEMAINIVGPNITNFVKDLTKKESKNKHKKPAKAENLELPESDDVDLFDIEFQMFLAQCTLLLDLPFAARRLFDSEGKELFSLQNLARDSLVYVSCGESWLDPRLTKQEQRRRFLLSQIASDVSKIQQFCFMRNPENFVLEINGVLAPGSSLIVKQKPPQEAIDSSQRQSTDFTTDDQIIRDDNDEDFDPDFRLLNSHERAHLKSDAYVSSLKWPWERLVNVSNSMDTEDPEVNKYTDRDMYMKYRPHTTSQLSKEAYQKFTFEDGYIAVVANRTLVLSLNKIEGRVGSVVLAKRQPDDINQRWIIRPDGEIISRAQQSLILTVSMPPTSSGEQIDLSFSNCPITVQPRCSARYGRAHQSWRYDPESGHIFAFDTNLLDKEITAANRADVCTSAVAPGVGIDQPGYFAEILNHGRDATKGIKVCVSCARSMRGRFKVQRLPPGTSFHCAMGDAKKLKIKKIGSFKYLNGKVDLTTHEADITLRAWQNILESLRQETSVHTIEKEINALKSVRLVRVVAYKNGEGRLRKGEIICGSSIEGILSQCTHRLGLSNAARKMYLEDGTLVLNVEDLIQYAMENFRNDVQIMLAKNAQKTGRLEIKMISETENPKADDENDEDEVAKLQRLQKEANNEVNRQLRKSLETLKTLNTKEEPGLNEENGQDDRQQDEEAQKDLDSQEAQKIYKENEELLKDVRLPPLDVILKIPVEVWVSSGKAFVSPEVVESKEENRRKKRSFRAQVGLELDIEKHVLRQMKGRRLEQMSPGVYRATLSSSQPVILEKHWQKPTPDELDKHEAVDKLQAHLDEIKSHQKETSVVSVKLEGKLYQQPNMKRVLVYQVGDFSERYVYVWGSSIEEILDSATSKLSMWKKAKTIYTQDGLRIENFDDIQRDQILCVSSGKSFKLAYAERKQIEVKANWGRTTKVQEIGGGDCGDEKQKLRSIEAADALVSVRMHPHVNVDPFGPPLLALPPGSNTFLQQ